ncbi:MAG TPA: cytochrome c3 family protein, partial [Desulfuromonadaceae bacterium]|nr:cytochrome c3 family protein [Desulfuromonadaceae bacterium]
MNGGKHIIALAAILCGLWLAAGCASDTQHKVLTLFFDGVPGPGNTNVAVVASEETPLPADKPAPPPPPPPVDLSSVHPPFRDQKCSQCHLPDTGMGLRQPAPKLCWTCHKDFTADQKVKHQPVAEGDCAGCHEPHRSDNKKLLLKAGNELCLTCHDDPLAGKKFKHQAVEAGNCLDCHAPHATNFKGLLRQSVKGTCADCHDDITKKK